MDKKLDEKIREMWSELPESLRKENDRLHEAIMSHDLHKYDGFFSLIKKEETPKSDNYYG